MSDDNAFGCFISVIGGIISLLTSLGVGLIFFSIQQAVGLSILFGLIGTASSNWVLSKIDTYLQAHQRDKKNERGER